MGNLLSNSSRTSPSSTGQQSFFVDTTHYASKIVEIMADNITKMGPHQIDPESCDESTVVVLSLYCANDRPDLAVVKKWPENCQLVIFRMSDHPSVWDNFDNKDNLFGHLPYPPIALVYFEPLDPAQVHLLDCSWNSSQFSLLQSSWKLK